MERSKEICRNIPVVAHMARDEDGNWYIDRERSVYADIPADDIARFLIEKFGHDAIFGEGAKA